MSGSLRNAVILQIKVKLYKATGQLTPLSLSSGDFLGPANTECRTLCSLKECESAWAESLNFKCVAVLIAYLVPKSGQSLTKLVFHTA